MDQLNAILAYILDWETGGLDCTVCGVTQISVHAVRLDTFERLGTFMRYILPYHRRTDTGAVKRRKTLKSKFDDGASDVLMEYAPEALAVQGATMDMLYEKGIPLDQMMRELTDWMDSFHLKVVKSRLPILVGQNIVFDEGFLSQAIAYTGMENEFQKRIRGAADFFGNWHPYMLDTIILGQLALAHNQELTSYKLEMLCEQLGIELVDAHDADADVEATEAVMTVLGNRMRNEGSNYTGADLPEATKDKQRRHFRI